MRPQFKLWLFQEEFTVHRRRLQSYLSSSITLILNVSEAEKKQIGSTLKMFFFCLYFLMLSIPTYLLRLRLYCL